MHPAVCSSVHRRRCIATDRRTLTRRRREKQRRNAPTCVPPAAALTSGQNNQIYTLYYAHKREGLYAGLCRINICVPPAAACTSGEIYTHKRVKYYDNQGFMQDQYFAKMFQTFSTILTSLLRIPVAAVWVVVALQCMVRLFRHNLCSVITLCVKLNYWKGLARPDPPLQIFSPYSLATTYNVYVAPVCGRYFAFKNRLIVFI